MLKSLFSMVSWSTHEWAFRRYLLRVMFTDIKDSPSTLPPQKIRFVPSKVRLSQANCDQALPARSELLQSSKPVNKHRGASVHIHMHIS